MRTKWWGLYSIVTTLLQEAALALVVLLGLPHLGINIPWWGLVGLMSAWGIWGYIGYLLGKSALRRKPMHTPGVVIGETGEAVMPLDPEGYVKINGELWKALSTGSFIDAGEEVTVIGIKRLTLMVRGKDTTPKFIQDGTQSRH